MIATNRCALVLLLIFLSFPALAEVVRFNATGDPDVSGYVEFDTTGLPLDGSCQSNTSVVGLSLQVTVGVETLNFGLADVTTSDQTQLDNTGGPLIIKNGCGDLANQGDWYIGFWPDGWLGTPMDGDAALLVDNRGSSPSEEAFAVRWELERANTPPVPTFSIWGLLLLTLSAGLVASSYLRRAR